MVNAGTFALSAKITLGVIASAAVAACSGNRTGGPVEVAAIDDTVTPPCVPYVIQGVAPAPNAYDGQFAPIDVVSVVAK